DHVARDALRPVRTAEVAVDHVEVEPRGIGADLEAGRRVVGQGAKPGTGMVDTRARARTSPAYWMSATLSPSSEDGPDHAWNEAASRRRISRPSLVSAQAAHMGE